MRVSHALCALTALQLVSAAALAQQSPTYPRDPPVASERSPGALDQQPSTNPTREAPADRYDAKSMTSVTPQSFVKQAATIGKAEVELGQLAMTNSSDPAVKKYAQQMVKDHTAAGEKLESIAAGQNMSLPTSLDAEHQALKDKLSSLKGEAFDREYAKAMDKGHDKAVALFEAASKSPEMPAQLKQYAASTLPTLKQHEEMAHSLKKKEGA